MKESHYNPIDAKIEPQIALIAEIFSHSLS